MLHACRDAHPVGEHAPALHTPAEPCCEKLTEHVADQVDRPRQGDLLVVEPEPQFKRVLYDRVHFPAQVKAGVRKPGRGEKLCAVAAQQRDIRVLH